MFKEESYEAAAKLIGCEVAAIKAVAEVESAGDGFTKGKNLMCLFEGHHFHRLTKGVYAMKYPKLSYPTWGEHARALYRKDKDQEFTLRYQAAAKLNKEAATMATSWGVFQIMGFHSEALGFETAIDMYEFLKENIDNHLALFAKFIMLPDNAGMRKSLRQKNWKTFALLYNGKLYYKNKYDEKMKQKYLEFSKIEK